MTDRKARATARAKATARATTPAKAAAGLSTALDAKYASNSAQDDSILSIFKLAALSWFEGKPEADPSLCSG
jgi:hypothetical protein